MSSIPTPSRRWRSSSTPQAPAALRAARDPRGRGQPDRKSTLAEQGRRADAEEASARTEGADRPRQAAATTATPTPPPRQRVAGQRPPPARRSRSRRAPVAQLAEQRDLNPKVEGSNSFRGRARVNRPHHGGIDFAPCSRSSTGTRCPPGGPDPRHRRGAAARRRRLRGASGSTAGGRSRSTSISRASSARPPAAPAARPRRGSRRRRGAARRAARRRRLARCASMVTRGGRRIAILEPMPALAETIALATVDLRADAPPRRHQVALLRREHARDAAREGAGRRRGAARDAPRAGARGARPPRSSAPVDGATLCTPPLSDHVLDSITRRAVLAASEVTEQTLALDDLAARDRGVRRLDAARGARRCDAIDGARCRPRPAR